MAIKEVTDLDDLMIITKSGILIRMEVATLRVMGRNTQGVKLIRLKNEDDEISSVTKIRKDPEEAAAAEVVELDEEGNPIPKATETELLEDDEIIEETTDDMEEDESPELDDESAEEQDADDEK